MAVVALDIEKFKKQYPVFNNLTPDDVYKRLFALACLKVNNTDNSVITDIEERETLLYLLMAHFAELDPGIVDANGSHGSGGLVGRVSSASEGSVSISSEYAAMTQNSAWYLQTQYGAMYWELISKYRKFRYIAPKRGCCRHGRH